MGKLLIPIATVAFLALADASAQEGGAPPRRTGLPSAASAGRGRAGTAPAVGAFARPERPPIPSGQPAPLAAPAAPRPEPVSVVPTKEPDKYRRTVFRLASAPAVDVARTLDQMFRAEGKVVVQGVTPKQVVIVADAVGNNLVVSGPPDAVEEIGRLVEQLDHPTAMVRLEVVIAEAAAESSTAVAANSPTAEKKAQAEASQPEGKRGGRLREAPRPDQMEVLARGQLTTLDNQPAFFQMGRRVPRVVGTSMTPMGTSNHVEFENMGFIVGVTPRVGHDGVVTLALDLEDSRLGSPEEGVTLSVSKDGQAIRTPAVETMTAQSTLRIPDGQTVTLAGMTRQGKPSRQIFLLITPQVLPIGLER